MTYETIRVSRDGDVATVTVHRPEKLNAFTPAMRDALIAAIDRADADDAVRVVIFTGAGRGFCAGADISEGGGRFDVSKRLAGSMQISDAEATTLSTPSNVLGGWTPPGS